MSEEQWKQEIIDRIWNEFDAISDELYVQIVAHGGGYVLVDRYELKTPLSPVRPTQFVLAGWLCDNKDLVAAKQHPGLTKSMLVMEAIAA